MLRSLSISLVRKRIKLEILRYQVQVISVLYLSLNTLLALFSIISGSGLLSSMSTSSGNIHIAFGFIYLINGVISFLCWTIIVCWVGKLQSEIKKIEKDRKNTEKVKSSSWFGEILNFSPHMNLLGATCVLLSKSLSMTTLLSKKKQSFLVFTVLSLHLNIASTLSLIGSTLYLMSLSLSFYSFLFRKKKVPLTTKQKQFQFTQLLLLLFGNITLLLGFFMYTESISITEDLVLPLQGSLLAIGLGIFASGNLHGLYMTQKVLREKEVESSQNLGEVTLILGPEHKLPTLHNIYSLGRGVKVLESLKN